MAGSGTLIDPYTTIASLQSGINATSLPATLYLLSGTYTAGLNMPRACTPGNELTVSVSDGAAKALGTAIMTGASSGVWFSANAAYNIIEGFDYQGTMTDVAFISLDQGGCNHNTIRHCKFTNSLAEQGINIGVHTSDNSYNRISYCQFLDTGTWAGYMVRIQNDFTANPHRTNNANNQIDHCWFKDHHNAGNYETIQIGGGTQTAGESATNYSTIVEYNFFDHCVGDENELISIKTSNNIIRFNTIIGGDGNINVRMGDNTLIEGNFFYYTAAPSTGDGGGSMRGINLSGVGAIVRNNYIQANGHVGSIYLSSGDNNHDNYWGAENALIINNTILDPEPNGGITFKTLFGGTYPPVNCSFINNLIESNGATASVVFGYNYLGTGHTWTTNRGHVANGTFKHASAGATDSGTFELTVQKAGLPVNWYYPSAYTNGTSNANVTTDIQGQARTVFSIGCDETGSGTDLTLAVGPSWQTQATLSGPASEIQSMVLGLSSVTATLSLTQTGLVGTINGTSAVIARLLARVLADSLISFWPLEEASGTRFDAVVATGNDLTDVNTVTQNTGKIGNCAEFTAANTERLTHVQNASLNTNTQTTHTVDWALTCWFYLNSVGVQHTLFCKRVSGQGLEYDVYIGTENNLHGIAGGEAGQILVTDTLSLLVSTWYFLVCQYNTANAHMTLQINNGTIFSNTLVDWPASNAGTLALGVRDTSTRPLNGRMDQVGFWKRLLTTDEITYLYNSGNGRSYAEMMGTTSALTAGLAPAYHVHHGQRIFG